MLSFSVTSEPKDARDQPIRVRSWLSEIQLKFPAHAKVFAEVKKGYLAVIGASVTATVERPIGPTVDVELRDDGLGKFFYFLHSTFQDTFSLHKSSNVVFQSLKAQVLVKSYFSYVYHRYSSLYFVKILLR